MKRMDRFEKHPIQNDVRRARRERKLGQNASCILCGEKQPEALTLIEQHHLAGRAIDPELKAPVCRNDHAFLQEGLRTAGVSMRQPETLLERIVEILKGLGAFFMSLGERLLEWARQLGEFLGALDEEYPAWRKEVDGQ